MVTALAVSIVDESRFAEKRTRQVRSGQGASHDVALLEDAMVEVRQSQATPEERGLEEQPVGNDRLIHSNVGDRAVSEQRTVEGALPEVALDHLHAGEEAVIQFGSVQFHSIKDGVGYSDE